MRIKLCGFRCHVDSEYSFTEGSITLLKGPSGIGKSTLFAAIFWTLYGSLHHIYNNAGTTNKCSVTLDFETPKMTVYRQKRPELLRLTMGDQTKYEDQVAQSIISGLFGPKEIWMACCYVPQGSRSYLLTASNADKMDLLNVLSFNTEDPDTFLSKIDTTLTGVTADFTARQNSFTAECEQFNREITHANLDMTLHLSLDDRKIMSSNLEKDKKYHAELSSRYHEEQRQRGILFSLQETHSSLMKQLTAIPLVPPEETTRLESELSLLNEKASSLPYLSAYYRLQNELTNLEQRLKEIIPCDFTMDVTEADISRATLEKQQYEENLALSKSCACPYDEISIASEIAKMSMLIDLQPRIAHYTKLKNEQIDIQQKLANLPFTDRKERDPITEEEIATATLQQQQYQEGVNACKALSCPYEETAIADEISRVTATIDLQPVLQTYQRLKGELMTVNSSLDETLRFLMPYGDIIISRPITDEYISEAVMATSVYEEGSSLAKSLNITYSESAISSEISSVNVMIDLQPILQTYQRMKGELTAVDRSLDETLRSLMPYGDISPRTITDEDISMAVMATSAYEEGSSLAKSLNIPYSESAILSEVSRLSSRLDLQPVLQTYQRLKAELTAVNNSLDETLRFLMPYGEISSRTITDDDISSAVMATSAYEEGSSLARALNIPYSESAISSEGSQLSSRLDLQPVLQTYQRLKSELTAVNNSLEETLRSLMPYGDVPPHTVTDEDISMAVMATSAYEEGSSLAKSLNIPYSESAVASEIYQLSSRIDLQPRLQTIIRYLTLTSQINTLMKSGNIATDEDVANAREALSKLHASMGVLKCPHCEKPVRAVNGSLLPGESLPPTPEEMERANYNLQVVTANRRRGLEIASLSQEVESLKSLCNPDNIGDLNALPAPWTPQDIALAKIRLSALSKLRVVALPKESPQLLRLLRTQTTLESKKTLLISEIDNVMSNYPISSLELPPWTPQEVSMVKTRLSALSKIRVVALPKESPQLLRLLRTKATLESKQTPLTSEMDKLTSNYPVSSLELPPWTPQEISMVKTRLSALSKIRVVAPPKESPQLLRLLRTKATLESKQTSLISEIDKLRSIHWSSGPIISLESPPWNPQEIAFAKNRVSALSKIRVVSPPKESPQLLRLLRTKATLESKKTLLISEIEKLTSDYPVVSLEAPPSNLQVLRSRLSALTKIRFVSAPLISPEILRIMFIRQTLESQHQNLHREIGKLLGENSLAELESVPINVSQLRSRMSSISRIRIVSPPQYDPLLLRMVLTRRTLERQKRDVLAEIEKLPSLDLLASLDATMITTNITRIKGRLAEISESSTRRKLLSSQIDDVLTRISAISLDDSLKDRIQNLCTSIEKMGAQLLANEKIDLFLAKQTELEKKRCDLEKIYKDMTTLQRLKTIALEVECHTLQVTVDSINIALSDIATHLFDDPISISLQLFKALKTKDRVKPTVNITISYRGGEYDNISQLSGGEGDRISLAITLALARINSCPLLLLDECMASLDANLKEACLKTLRRNLGNHKTVISINHEGTEGTYDSVVTLGI